MVYKVAINGYGRIGRNVLRALYESGYRDRIQVVGINEDGKNVIKVFDAASGQQIEFPTFDNGDITRSAF